METHDSWHVVALVGRRHQSAEVGFAAQAHLRRRTLVLHVFGDSSRREQAGGGAVVGVAAVSWTETNVRASWLKSGFMVNI